MIALLAIGAAPAVAEARRLVDDAVKALVRASSLMVLHATELACAAVDKGGA